MNMTNKNLLHIISFTIPMIGICTYYLLFSSYVSNSSITSTFKNQNILVTGASQGIGKEIVLDLVGRGANVLLVSRNLQKLQDVKRQALLSHPTSTSTIHILSKDLSTETAADETVAFAEGVFGGKLDTLILNHITNSRVGTWLGDHADSQGFLLPMFHTNFFSYVWLATKSMDMLERSSGRIGVVSSLAGFVGTPKTSVYSATKHALMGFFDAFRIELKMLGKDNVSVTIASIGATDTEGAREYAMNEMSSKISWDPADRAARAILEGLTTRKRNIFHPHHLVFPSVLINAHAPSVLDYVLRKTIEI